MVSDQARQLPIFWGHGKADPLVTFEKATSSLEFLKAHLGIDEVEPDAVLDGGIEFHAYDALLHTVDDRELDELRAFLKKVVP